MDYKILIADDEPEIRNLLRLYLENENYHVIEAEDGQRALDLLRAEQPAPQKKWPNVRPPIRDNTWQKMQIQ